MVVEDHREFPKEPDRLHLFQGRRQGRPGWEDIIDMHGEESRKIGIEHKRHVLLKTGKNRTPAPALSGEAHQPGPVVELHFLRVMAGFLRCRQYPRRNDLPHDMIFCRIKGNFEEFVPPVCLLQEIPAQGIDPVATGSGGGDPDDLAVLREDHRCALQYSTRPPARRISCIRGDNGRIVCRSPPVSTQPPDRSNITGLPSSQARSDSMSGSPILIAFRKKIRAKDGAMTATTPASRRARAACSLEEPHPKFLPATITAPLSRGASAGSRSSNTWVAQMLRSLVRRYRPAMMRSVSISAGRRTAVPLPCIILPPAKQSPLEGRLLRL